LSIQKVLDWNMVTIFVGIDGSVMENVFRWLAHDLLGAIFVSE
jgi:hypothetical protein